MNLRAKPYLEQAKTWPRQGRHILAQYDAESIIVYQAYRPEIGHYASRHGHFGGAFSYSRMSWIKPNFLWMMYRSGWGTKPGQEVTLAVRLPRSLFDEILAQAVPSSFHPKAFETREAWSEAVKTSDVRLQWDPDHGPTGDKVERRAIQLGLRGPVLGKYGKDELLEVTDISDFVAEQRRFANPDGYGNLVTPAESVYKPADSDLCQRLALAEHPDRP
ncbi:MAG: DUF4291 domain-containing protein [Acidobacteriota bacterium]